MRIRLKCVTNKLVLLLADFGGYVRVTRIFRVSIFARYVEKEGKKITYPLCDSINMLSLGRTRVGGGGGGPPVMDATPAPPSFFLSFSLRIKISAPVVFSSCLFMPRAKFETCSVTVGCYGYEI